MSASLHGKRLLTCFKFASRVLNRLTGLKTTLLYAKETQVSCIQQVLRLDQNPSLNRCFVFDSASIVILFFSNFSLLSDIFSSLYSFNFLMTLEFIFRSFCSDNICIFLSWLNKFSMLYHRESEGGY